MQKYNFYHLLGVLEDHLLCNGLITACILQRQVKCTAMVSRYSYNKHSSKIMIFSFLPTVLELQDPVPDPEMLRSLQRLFPAGVQPPLDDLHGPDREDHDGGQRRWNEVHADRGKQKTSRHIQVRIQYVQGVFSPFFSANLSRDFRYFECDGDCG